LRPRRQHRVVPSLRRHGREADGREGRGPRRDPGGPRVMAEAKTARQANEWPDEGELVVCTVTNVKNFGGFVTLDEYENNEGFKGAWVKTVVEVARENIVPPHVTIDGYVEAMDFCPDGAVHIREALTKAVQEDDGITVKVQYIGAPRYRIVVRAPDYKTAEDEIEKAANRVIKALTAKGGEAKF